MSSAIGLYRGRRRRRVLLRRRRRALVRAHSEPRVVRERRSSLTAAGLLLRGPQAGGRRVEHLRLRVLRVAVLRREKSCESWVWHLVI
jgi:hypothetical protein